MNHKYVDLHYRYNFGKTDFTARYCSRCKKKYHLTKHGYTKNNSVFVYNNYCNECRERDFYLLCKVKDCIRLMGGMITLHNLINLYDNEEVYKNLKKDPFREAREIYKGENRLQLKDIHKWIEEGLLRKNQSLFLLKWNNMYVGNE